MSSTVIVEHQGRVALVQLNRPDAANAINMEMRQALYAELNRIARDPDIGAIVLTATGKNFCAGGDLKGAAASEDKSMRKTARTLLHDIQPLIECISRSEKPIIAAVNGAAAGFGMSLALSCDLLLMADNASLVCPFVNFGLMPDGGGAFFLTRRIGYARAMEVMLGSQKLSAARCVELGLANRQVAASDLIKQALDLASEFAAKPPLAVALTKRIARTAMSASLSDVMSIEAEFQTVLASSEDAREAISAFADKRSPEFRGR